MPRVGFEPMTPVIERAKTVHALDCAGTVIGDLHLMAKVIRVELYLHSLIRLYEVLLN
jgi:hypothetical protein